MRHIRVVQHLPFYVNDTLDDKKRAAMEEHLQSCADCREELKRVRIEIATVRELNADVEPLTDSAIRRAMHKKEAGEAAASAFQHLPQLSLLQKIVAMAAVLVIVGGIVIVTRQKPAEPTLRGDIHSLIADDHPLPRNNFLLRWSGGPPGARYHLTVTTSELKRLVLERDVERPEYRIPPERLAGLASGARILCHVEARTPDGSVISYGNFAVSVE
jgi:hypothetical protein